MKKEEYSLVYKAIHGDSHAYGELIHQYNPYFYKIAFLSLYKKIPDVHNVAHHFCMINYFPESLQSQSFLYQKFLFQ